MTEETTNVEVEPEVEVHKPVREAQNVVLHNPPRVVKEAEHKLKEMSRKAKERKTAQNTSKQKKLSEINYFWLVIGGLGALGVGYLVFGSKEPTPSKRPRFKFVPKPKTPDKPRESVKDSISTRHEVIEKEEKSASTFELNCF